MRRRWCASVQSCGPAVWFPASCVYVCLLAALQLPLLLHSSNDSQRRCQRTASLLLFSLSLSLFSSSSRCCCAGPSLVGDSSLSLCHATLPAFPIGRWGRRKREREREKKKKSREQSIIRFLDL